MSTQYPIHGNLATAEYCQSLDDRARSLGLPVNRLVSLMNVGFGEPPIEDAGYYNKIHNNPNRNLMKTSLYWYLMWKEKGVRKHRRMSTDIVESRRMRDEFFAEIGYYNKK
jgi:hypothetical protein